MAVFVLVAKEGTGYVPPACGATPMFADVPPSNPFCRWIEELARRAVVSGCGGGNYCPTSAVTREQMAVFVLRTLDPALAPPACTTPIYNDVPASSGFCRWIEELTRRSGRDRLRWRQLLPDGVRDPRADGCLHQRDVWPDAVRSVASPSALSRSCGSSRPAVGGRITRVSRADGVFIRETAGLFLYRP